MTIEFPKGDIRQLNDAELELVNGGSYAGQVAAQSAETLAVLVPALLAPFPLLPVVVTGAYALAFA